MSACLVRISALKGRNKPAQGAALCDAGHRPGTRITTADRQALERAVQWAVSLCRPFRACGGSPSLSQGGDLLPGCRKWFVAIGFALPGLSAGAPRPKSVPAAGPRAGGDGLRAAALRRARAERAPRRQRAQRRGRAGARPGGRRPRAGCRVAAKPLSHGARIVRQQGLPAPWQKVDRPGLVCAALSGLRDCESRLLLGREADLAEIEFQPLRMIAV